MRAAPSVAVGARRDVLSRRRHLAIVAIAHRHFRLLVGCSRGMHLTFTATSVPLSRRKFDLLHYTAVQANKLFNVALWTSEEVWRAYRGWFGQRKTNPAARCGRKPVGPRGSPTTHPRPFRNPG